MKKVLIFLLTFSIGIVLFFFVIKWVGWQEIKQILFDFRGWKGAVILGLTLLIWLVEVWRLKFVLKCKGYNFPVWQLLEIAFSSMTISYLFTPTALFGGEGFMVYALRKKFSLDWDKDIAVVAIEKVLTISIILLFLILGALSFFFLVANPARNFVIIIVFSINALIVALGFFYIKSSRKESIFKYFLKFFGIKKSKDNQVLHNIEEELFHFFDFRKKEMWQGLGITFVRHFLMLCRCWFLILFLSGKMSLLAAFIILFFMYVSYLLPIPAGIGALEASQAFAFGALGLNRAMGITFSFILRGAEVIVSLFGLILLIKLIIKIFTEDIGNFFQKLLS